MINVKNNYDGKNIKIDTEKDILIGRSRWYSNSDPVYYSNKGLIYQVGWNMISNEFCWHTITNMDGIRLEEDLDESILDEVIELLNTDRVRFLNEYYNN